MSSGGNYLDFGNLVILRNNYGLDLVQVGTDEAESSATDNRLGTIGLKDNRRAAVLVCGQFFLIEAGSKRQGQY